MSSPSPKLLVVQPSELDPPERLADWLRDAGAELVIVRPHSQPLPSTMEGFAGVICLGGEMATNDDSKYPWLAGLRRLLAHAVDRRVPVLAICLGAQLLALATGGQVRRCKAGPEAGVLLVAKRDAAAGDPLFGELPLTPDVLQFHQDEIHVLPPGAQLLASSPRCANQAFRIGRSGYGVQFHIETSPELVKEWAWRAQEIAAVIPPGQLDPLRLASAHEDIAEAWQPAVRRFVQLAAGDLEPAAPRHQLPLA